MRSIRLRNKILILVSFFYVVFLSLSILAIIEKVATVEELRALHTLSQLSSEISAYVHETQKERGITGLFLGSEGKHYAQELNAQRSITDSKRNDLNAFLSSFDLQALGPDFKHAYRCVMHALPELEPHRDKVDSDMVSAKESIKFYSHQNRLMLNCISHISKHATNANASRIISAYLNIMHAKEKAGIERAVIGSALTSGEFHLESFDYYISLVSAQQVHIEAFISHASPEQISLFNETMLDPVIDEIRRIKENAFTGYNGRDLKNVNPDKWFQLMTRKLDLMKQTEVRLRYDLNSTTAAIKHEATRALAVYTIAIAAVLAFLTGISTVIIHSVISPINALMASVRRIKNGDLSCATGISSTDEIGRFATAFDDMAAQLQRERTALKDSNIELAAINSELDEFAHIVSHDLKAPLLTMDAYCSMLDSEYRDNMDEKEKKYLDRIIKSKTLLSELLSDLSSLTKVSKINEPEESIITKEIISTIIDRMSYVIEDKKVEINIETDLPVIKSSRIKLTEVFFNLINNAIKYSSGNATEPPNIRIGYTGDKNHHKFFIKDNGIGIEPEYHEKIFAVFTRLHSDDVYEGTGAGLSIVKRIIDDLGGDIWVDSELGKGATFHFTIPKESSKGQEMVNTQES